MFPSELVFVNLIFQKESSIQVPLSIVVVDGVYELARNLIICVQEMQHVSWETPISLIRVLVATYCPISLKSHDSEETSIVVELPGWVDEILQGQIMAFSKVEGAKCKEESCCFCWHFLISWKDFNYKFKLPSESYSVYFSVRN